MKGLIVMNGYPSAEKFYRQSERIKRALESLGVKTDVLLNGEVSASLSETAQAKTSLNDYSFCVYLDKDKYLSHILEGAGLRLFNSASSVELCDDKMTTYLSLQGAGVKIPETISAPLCYTPKSQTKKDFLDRVENLGYPLVAKKSYGSFGAGVKLVENREQLEQTEQEWLYLPHFYQSFVGKRGMDIRVIVIGGKAVAGMRRIAKEGEFRSNIELGGRGEGIHLPKEYALTAEKVAKHLGLDYCGVDLLEGGEPIVCEVNSNAFFEGIESA
ncbi:MAG: RimK family alpha-L-glutamate ligase, partial [Clostridia bacterium]|nr:RimK family alpha-L-glutamate ligase [Clostridia bacterium]